MSSDNQHGTQAPQSTGHDQLTEEVLNVLVEYGQQYLSDIAGIAIERYNAFGRGVFALYFKNVECAREFIVSAKERQTVDRIEFHYIQQETAIKFESESVTTSLAKYDPLRQALTFIIIKHMMPELRAGGYFQLNKWNIKTSAELVK